MTDDATPAKVRLTDGLGGSPTDAEDRAFWAFLIVANVWSASDATGWLRWAIVLLWMAFAVAVRWPYLRRMWLRRDGA